MQPEYELPAEVVEIIETMRLLRRRLHAAKPNDRSQLDRFYAIALTNMEQTLAHYAYWMGAFYTANPLDEE